MTPRERVVASLQHKEPDRVPIDLGSSRATSIHAIAYNRLKAHLGIADGHTRVYDIWQQISLVEDEIVNRFGIDVLPLNLMRVHFGLSNAEWKEYTLPDGSPAEISSEFKGVREEDGAFVLKDKSGTAIAKMPSGSYWFDHIYFPLQEAASKADIDKYDWEGQLLRDDELKYLARESKRLYEETDHAIHGHFGGSILEMSQMLLGFENAMMDIAIDPGFFEYMLDRMVELHLENLRRYLNAVGDHIQVIYVADDLGTQNGLWLHPDRYRSLFKPRHRKIYRYIKDNSDLFIFLHSCGAIHELIPDIIDVGVDIINPVQISARGMDPRALKKEFGKDVTFWGGGIDTQHLLPEGTPEEVRRRVRENIEIFAPGGGFIFNQVHNIQADVPPENIVAMFDEAQKSGTY